MSPSKNARRICALIAIGLSIAGAVLLSDLMSWKAFCGLFLLFWGNNLAMAIRQ